MTTMGTGTQNNHNHHKDGGFGNISSTAPGLFKDSHRSACVCTLLDISKKIDLAIRPEGMRYLITRVILNLDI